MVNNCAAAVLLAAAALAAGRELVVSRGQLVEIGGSFRIPDVVAQSGATLVEVGTTNRTRLADYERAIGEAHRRGAAGAPVELPHARLRGAGGDRGAVRPRRAGDRRRRLGALAEGVPELGEEPAVRRSVAAGCALVCFSGDKLLGGPQAGLMAGTPEAIERCRVAPAGPRAADRQALAGRARGDAAAVPRSRARAPRDPGAAHAHRGPGGAGAPRRGDARPAERRRRRRARGGGRRQGGRRRAAAARAARAGLRRGPGRARRGRAGRAAAVGRAAGGGPRARGLAAARPAHARRRGGRPRGRRRAAAAALGLGLPPA